MNMIIREDNNMGTRVIESGICWDWYMTDTIEEAVKWFTELTGEKPYRDDICEMIQPKDGCEWSFRLHK